MSGPIDKDWLARELPREADDRDLDLDALPKCPGCGYVIYKLAGGRCPECGRELRLEDIAPNVTRLEMDRIDRRERRMIWIGAGLMVVATGLILLVTRKAPHESICFIGPLGGVTLTVLGYRFLLGDTVHGAFFWGGMVWLLLALGLVLIRLL